MQRGRIKNQSHFSMFLIFLPIAREITTITNIIESIRFSNKSAAKKGSSFLENVNFLLYLMTFEICP